MEAILLNLVKSLMISKVQNLAKEHIEQAIDDQLDDNQKKLLDTAVDLMPDNKFKTLKDFLN